MRPRTFLADDQHDALLEVDVFPPQRRRVAETQAREGQRRDQREVLRVGRLHRAQKGPEGFGGQGVVVLLLVLGKGDAKRGVSRQAERLHRVAGHRAQDPKPPLIVSAR